MQFHGLFKPNEVWAVARMNKHAFLHLTALTVIELLLFMLAQLGEEANPSQN